MITRTIVNNPITDVYAKEHTEKELISGFCKGYSTLLNTSTNNLQFKDRMDFDILKRQSKEYNIDMLKSSVKKKLSIERQEDLYKRLHLDTHRRMTNDHIL
jgi:hypothetical protein